METFEINKKLLNKFAKEESFPNIQFQESRCEKKTLKEPKMNTSNVSECAESNISWPSFDVYFANQVFSYPGARPREVGMQVILDDDQKTRITVTNWGQPGEKQQKMVSFTAFEMDLPTLYI